MTEKKKERQKIRIRTGTRVPVLTAEPQVWAPSLTPGSRAAG